MNRIILVVVYTLVFLEISSAANWTSITVRNNGGYIARFEASYEVGTDIFIEKSDHFPVGESRTILLAPDATEIIVQVENLVFRNEWSTIFTENITSGDVRCFTISGTTTMPKWHEHTC